jgi:hypothetical protein
LRLFSGLGDKRAILTRDRDQSSPIGSILQIAYERRMRNIASFRQPR